MNFAKVLRIPFLQNTYGRLLLNNSFLNQHLIEVSKLLVFVLFFFSLFQILWSKHFFKNNGAMVYLIALIAKVERKETFYLKHETIF